MPAGALEQLHFRGMPPLLSLVEQVSEPMRKPGSYRFDVGGNQAVLSVRPMLRAATDYSWLRLKIAKSTPPGTYLSRFALDDHEVPVLVEVEPCTDLRFIPASLSLAVEPGGTAQATLTIINAGNAQLQLGQEDTFCVFDASGVDRAFYSALTEDLSGGQRLERFLEELAGSHGGIVRIRIAEGPIEIPAGEARKFRLALACSHRLRPGQTYTGLWSIEKFKYSIELTVAKTRKGSKK